MKVFQGNSTTINPEKKVFQDFTVTGGTTGSNFDLKLSVVGKNEPMIPEVWPRSLNIVAGKQSRFSVTYTCKKLLDKSGPYFDTVRVIASDTQSSEEVIFEYIVVCDAEKLGAFDLNFLVLFAIAIGIIILAIKTPPLLIFNDMTQEE